MNWRTRTEDKLHTMGEIITAHPIKIIIFMMIISMGIISNIPKITIDTSTEGFLHAEDPALVKYEKFKEQYGQDEKIMVVVHTKNIFDPETGKTIKLRLSASAIRDLDKAGSLSKF